MQTTERTRLLDADGHALGIYPTRAEAEEALRRRPDAEGGSIEPAPTPLRYLATLVRPSRTGGYPGVEGVACRPDRHAWQDPRELAALWSRAEAVQDAPGNVLLMVDTVTS